MRKNNLLQSTNKVLNYEMLIKITVNHAERKHIENIKFILEAYF